MAPESFGPFRTVQQIGAGALGPVFRARQPDTSCLVAVKLLSLGLRDERLHQLFAQLNALIPLSLDHFNIATPLAVGISGASVYLAQELAAGDPLEHLQRDRLAVRAVDVAQLTAEIASALDFAAAAGVVHGRLNPRDVLVSAPGIRVTGFGVARALEHIHVDAPLREPYAAPERLLRGPWGARADTFSLAAMMFELLWGRRPAGTGEQAVQGTEEIAGTNLRLLRTAFAQALAADPADRFATAGEFATHVKIACAPELSLTGGSKRWKPPVTAPRRRSAVVLSPRLPLDPEDDADTEADDELPLNFGGPALPAMPTTPDQISPAMQLESPIAAMFEEVFAMPATPSPQAAMHAETASAPAGGAKAARRYSFWWPFVAGPALGIVIGYALIPTLDHYRDRQRPRDEVRRAEPLSTHYLRTISTTRRF